MKNLNKTSAEMILTGFWFSLMGIVLTMGFKYQDELKTFWDLWIEHRKTRM